MRVIITEMNLEPLFRKRKAIVIYSEGLCNDCDTDFDVVDDKEGEFFEYNDVKLAVDGLKSELISNSNGIWYTSYLLQRIDKWFGDVVKDD